MKHVFKGTVNKTCILKTSQDPILGILVVFWIFQLSGLLLLVSVFQGPQASELLLKRVCRILRSLARAGHSTCDLQKMDKSCSTDSRGP